MSTNCTKPRSEGCTHHYPLCIGLHRLCFILPKPWQQLHCYSSPRHPALTTDQQIIAPRTARPTPEVGDSSRTLSAYVAILKEELVLLIPASTSSDNSSQRARVSRLDLILGRRLQPPRLAVPPQLEFDRLLPRRPSAEPVPFAREQLHLGRPARRPDFFEHVGRLRGRDDLVNVALEEEERRRDLVGLVDRRAGYSRKRAASAFSSQ